MKLPTVSEIFRWNPASWLRATGPDAAAFLQGQFTNDLRALGPGGCAYGLWLNVKGKVLSDSFVLRGTGPEEFWIGSYHAPAQVIRERLESHVIADDVTLEDETDRWRGVTVLGAVGGRPTLAVAQELASAIGGFAFPGRRGGQDHAEWVYPTAAEREVAAAIASATERSAEEMEQRRIESGVPAVPADIGPGELPNEGGMEADAISYTKGCYLGQEVMARLKSMGQVRRRLVRVEGPAKGAVPHMPAAVFAGGRQVGELRSAALRPDGALVGLALVSLLHVKPDTRLAFAADAEPVLRLVDAP